MQKIDLKNLTHNSVFHFIGIDGIGMSSIAEVLFKMGFGVQGSNDVDGENIKSLEDLGIKVFIGHNETNIDGADYIVFSSAVPLDNVEIVKANQYNIPVIERAEMLQWIMETKKSIGISGTHGKTTTTSFVGTMLDIASLDPTIVDGGIMNHYQSHNKAGNGDFVVAEVCEAFGNLQHFTSDIAVITNIDAEHMEFYKTFENLENYFRGFIKRVPKDGLIVACYDHNVALKLAEEAQDEKQVITYGFNNNADVVADNVTFNIDGSNFDLRFKDGRELKDVKIPLIGMHNVSNAMAAVAVADFLNISFDNIRKALSFFTGTKHRFTKVGDVDGIKIFDDYAHHPKEIETTLDMAKNVVGDGKIFAIFQPHRYSRLTDLFEDFTHCFSKSDFVICMPVYSAGESPVGFKNHEDFFENIQKIKGKNVFKINNFDEIRQIILSNAKTGDIIISFGAGSIKHMIYDLPLLLKK